MNGRRKKIQRAQKTLRSSRNMLAAAAAAAALVLCMTACGSADADPTSAAAAAEKNSSQEEAVQETEETGDYSTDESEISEGEKTQAESSHAAYTEKADASSLQSVNENVKLQVEVSTAEEEVTPEGQKTTCETKLDSISAADSGHEALEEVLEADNKEAAQLMEEQVASLYADYGDAPEESPAAELGYAVDDTVILKRADEKVVSYLHCNYLSFGGAHPTTAYSSRNYDTQTGEALVLSSVASDYDGIYEYVMEALAKMQEEDGAFFDDYKTSVEQIFYGESGMSDAASESAAENGSGVIWYMTDDCVTIVLDTYSIGPYAIGPTTVQVPFTTGLLDTDYEVQ
jgi:hypothetical protein